MIPRRELTLTPPQDTLFGRTVTPAERLRQHQRSLQKAQRELERERNKLEQQEKKTMADIKRNAKQGNMVSRVGPRCGRQGRPRKPLLSQSRASLTPQNACKILAKDLVRTRRYMQKFTQMRVQLQAVSLRMQTLRSNEQMASAMKGATRVGSRGTGELCQCRGRAPNTTLTATGNGPDEPQPQPSAGKLPCHEAETLAPLAHRSPLPQIQRIMNEFEKESATMDMKEELMSDAVDDAMEDEEEEGEEVESDKILKEVLDEIGLSMNESVSVARRARSARSGSSSLSSTALLTRPARVRTHHQPNHVRAAPAVPRRSGRGRARPVGADAAPRVIGQQRRRRAAAQAGHASEGLVVCRRVFTVVIFAR